MTTALGMVRAGLGIAVLPESAGVADNIPQVRKLAIVRPVLSRKVEIVRRKDRSLSPAALGLMAMVHECAQKLASAT
jgi:DNA-binding transcriptional LysR family regulator